MKRNTYMVALAASLTIPAVIAPVGVQASAAEMQFSDVSETSRYHEAVTDIVEKGIIFGYEDHTFRPHTEITRVQVAMLMSRALPLDPVRGVKDFKDVPNTYKHYEAIQKVQRAGIIDGAGNRNFYPGTTLTRGQMAKILAVGFDLEVKAEYDFPDVPESHWANKYVRALYSNGITVGNNGSFEPDESVTRGQYALFMHRLMNLDKDFEPTPVPKPEVKPDVPLTPLEPSTPLEKPEKPEQPKPEKPTPPTNEGNVELETDKYPDRTSVPKPDGYVAGKWEEQKAKEADEISKKNQYENGTSKFNLNRVNGTNSLQERLEKMSKVYGMSVQEFVGYVNQAIITGELIVTDKFTMFYDYKYGFIEMRG